MAANNACGARWIRYEIMVDNLLAIDTLMAGGQDLRFGEVPGNLEGVAGGERYLQLIQDMRALALREADAIAAGFPKVSTGSAPTTSTGSALPATTWPSCWSAQGLARPVPKAQAQAPAPAGAQGPGRLPFSGLLPGRCGISPAIVRLGPSAVELVDRSIIELGRQIPAYRPLIDRFVRGTPDALLLVEFAGDRDSPNSARS